MYEKEKKTLIYFYFIFKKDNYKNIDKNIFKNMLF